MRMLNSVEKAWLHIGENGSANAVRCFRVEGPLHFDLVERVFKVMVSSFPILRSRIVKHERQEFFQTDDAHLPKLQHHLGDFESNEIGHLVEELLNSPIDPRTEPLIQFVFLESIVSRQHCFLINFHHSISDGATNVAFMSQFLALCDAAIDSEESLQEVIGSFKEVTDWSPSLTESFPHQGFVTKTAAVLSFLGRRILKEATHHCVLLRPKGQERPAKSRVLQLTWSEELAERLRLAGKSDNLSVHSSAPSG